MLSPWLGAQPEGPPQRSAYLQFGSPGMPRRLGQRNDLSRLVPLLGLREHLATPVIGKLAGLMWVHVIHLLPPGSTTARATWQRGLAVEWHGSLTQMARPGCATSQPPAATSWPSAAKSPQTAATSRFSVAHP